MPDENEQQQDGENKQEDENSNDNQQQNNKNKTIVLGCDNNSNNKECQDTVEKALKEAGYQQVKKLEVAPGPYAEYSYTEEAKGKIGVYLMAGSLVSFLDGADAFFDYNIFGIRGDVSDTLGTTEGFAKNKVPPDWDGCAHPKCGEYGNKYTYPELNEMYKDRCKAVPGNTHEELAQNIIEALGGQFNGTGQVVDSGGGAQIKDKTFEKCIRRICAATDSIFLVENNAAVLFPYTDWMAFTLRQKINEIKSDEIDPNVFSIENNNDGFYNKVSIAWGGATLPEKKASDKDTSTNYTMQDVMSNMLKNNFSIANLSKKQENKIVNKKNKTTQEMSVDENGVTILSEQYDSLVEIYGEHEKRVESKAPDLETAQYIVNALLIQYVRDFNNQCKCRALNNRRYIGGTFYAVENPSTKKSELFYLNGYTIRTQKFDVLYHDLDFRYGPEGAEELLDYQTYGGGSAGTNGQLNADGSADEKKIWTEGAKIHYGGGCSEQDPEAAYKALGGHEGEDNCSADCYGMSAYLYYRFNYQAGIPCRVVGNSDHHVVMLYKNNQWQKTQDEYRSYNFEYNFKWRGDQDTTTLLEPPNISQSQSGGNTDPKNTNGGNGGDNK